MSVFTVPSIRVDKIETIEDSKEYLRELNKKIRYLVENIDSDNFDSNEYKRLYENGDRAVSLSHSLDEFRIEVNDYKDNMTARISQTASEIDLLVSKGTVTSRVNLSPEKITLSAGKLIVDSDNFKLDAAGNLTMKGTINATSGKFGNYQIVSENGKQFLRDTNGTINAADLSGTDIVTRDLNIMTDADVSGCSIDFSNCNVITSKSTYLGWFYTEDVRVSANVYCNCASCEELYVSGPIYCFDYWSNDLGIAYYSDENLKEDIKGIDGKEALEYLMRLRPVSYRFKGDETVHYGLIAQEILKTGDPYKLVHLGSGGHYTVSYDKLNALIVASIKEQMKEARGLDGCISSEI